jgi:hypothetical protein
MASYRKFAAPPPPLAEPVHADEGQQMVDVDRILGQFRGPDPSFADLLDDPGELHDRRVGEAVGDRLRPGRLEGEVAKVLVRALP